MKLENSLQDKLDLAKSRIPWMLTVDKLTVINLERTVEEYIPLRLRPANGIDIVVYGPASAINDTGDVVLGEAVDTFIFLPITVGEFISHRIVRTGYLYTFERKKFEIIQLLRDFDGARVDIDMVFNTRRISYQTRGRSTILIKHISDPVSPGITMGWYTSRKEYPGELIEKYQSVLNGYTAHHLVYTDV